MRNKNYTALFKNIEINANNEYTDSTGFGGIMTRTTADWAGCMNKIS